MKKQHEKIVLPFAFVALALASSTTAFTHMPVVPTTTTRRQAIPTTPQPPVLNQPLVLYATSKFNNDNENNSLKEDWKTLTKAAGNIARSLGDKAKHAIQEGSSKVKEFLHQGTESVVTAFLPESSKVKPLEAETELAAHDEDLFRSLLGDEGLFVVPSVPAANSLDFVVEKAASVLSKDDIARSLLGPSLRYGRPFSQSCWTTSSSTNGRTQAVTLLRASFDVWGSQGQGVASVASTDGTLTSLDLQVHGRRYSLNTSTRFAQEEPHAEAHSAKNDSIEVEILEGIRRTNAEARSGNVWDAEILDN